MTAGELKQKWATRVGSAGPQFRRTAEALARNAEERAKERMRETIYAVPEDTSRTGRKKWVRTERLLEGEHGRLRGAFEVVLVNDQRYAEPRHEAGKPGRRKIDPRRVSHWRDDVAQELRPVATEAFHKALLAILEG